MFIDQVGQHVWLLVHPKTLENPHEEDGRSPALLWLPFIHEVILVRGYERGCNPYTFLGDAWDMDQKDWFPQCLGILVHWRRLDRCVYQLTHYRFVQGIQRRVWTLSGPMGCFLPDDDGRAVSSRLLLHGLSVHLVHPTKMTKTCAFSSLACLASPTRLLA